METLFNILAVVLPLILIVLAGSVLSLLLAVLETKASDCEKTEFNVSLGAIMFVLVLYIYLLSAKFIIL